MATDYFIRGEKIVGTNYYFKFKKDLDINIIIDGTNACESIMNEIMRELLEEKIHIGKKSYGWKPTFQKTKYYSSLEGIKLFYDKNEEYLIIVDEYGKQYSFEEVMKELLDFNPVYDRSMIRYSNIYRDDEGYEFSETDFI